MLRHLPYFKTAKPTDPGDMPAKAVEEYLETFTLDEFGKHGIMIKKDQEEDFVEEGENPDLAKGAKVAAAGIKSHYDHAVHIKQVDTNIRVYEEPRSSLHKRPPVDVLAMAGGQRPVRHCLPLTGDCIEQIPLEQTKAYRAQIQQQRLST